DRRPVPTLAAGELYIAGAQLSRGYLGLEDLTREHFVAHPFAVDRIIYRSGDRARRLAGGTIEYLGRTDEQVKFHGHRVELGEIQSVLSSHPQVRDSVVMLGQDRARNEYLVAYYTSRQEISPAELRAHLAQSLVEETIPQFFLRLPR